MHDALALERAGACCVVLEGIPREVAAMITHELEIPTIGIGAGPECDGQVLVFHDLLGLTFAPPAKFVRRYADVGSVISNALAAFKDDVKSGGYPSDAESYHLPKETLVSAAGNCRTQAGCATVEVMQLWFRVFDSAGGHALSGPGCGLPDHYAPPVHKSISWKQYCQPDGGFCFRYPASWEMLGDTFAAMAWCLRRRKSRIATLWDEITVAMVVPPPEGDEEAVSLDGVIQQASNGLRQSGQSFETLQRQQRTVDHKPAQMLKAQYREKSTERDWIEELVFIQGPDNEIYSVALKCTPENLARRSPC